MGTSYHWRGRLQCFVRLVTPLRSRATGRNCTVFPGCLRSRPGSSSLEGPARPGPPPGPAPPPAGGSFWPHRAQRWAVADRGWLAVAVRSGDVATPAARARSAPDAITSTPPAPGAAAGRRPPTPAVHWDALGPPPCAGETAHPPRSRARATCHPPTGPPRPVLPATRGDGARGPGTAHQPHARAWHPRRRDHLRRRAPHAPDRRGSTSATPRHGEGRTPDSRCASRLSDVERPSSTVFTG